MFVLKYKAVRLEEYVQNAEVIGELQRVLDVPARCSVPNFLFFGESGSGKTTICNLLLNALAAEPKHITQSNLVKRDYVKDLYRYSTPSSIFVIDNLQHYTSITEKQQLYNLIHLNASHHFATIILITNQPQQKFIQEKLLKKCSSYRFELPSSDYVEEYIERVCEAEGIVLHESLQAIIEQHRNHIDSILNHISLIQSQQTALGTKYSDFSSISTIDILDNLLTKRHTYNNIKQLIKYATFVLPMFVYSNFYKRKRLEAELYVRVLEDMRKGDIVECAVFHAQRWFLNDTHVFYSIVHPAHLLQARPSPPSKSFKLIQYFNKKPPSISNKQDIFQFKVVQRYAREKNWAALKAYAQANRLDIDALLRKFGQIKLISMKVRKQLVANGSNLELL
jgi:DNA polymerase III delta prime subunit